MASSLLCLMRDFLRLLVIVSSVVILAFGVLELIGCVSVFNRHEQIKSISPAILGIVLVTAGVAGISAAVSLVDWFIGTYYVMAIILTGFVMPKVVKLDQMDWSPESLKRLSNSLEDYLKSVDPVFFKDLLITAYDILIVILVCLMISFVSSLALLYVNRRIKTSQKNGSSHLDFSTKSFKF